MGLYVPISGACVTTDGTTKVTYWSYGLQPYSVVAGRVVIVVQDLLDGGANYGIAKVFALDFMMKNQANVGACGSINNVIAGDPAISGSSVWVQAGDAQSPPQPGYILLQAQGVAGFTLNWTISGFAVIAP